ncbi:uncharacterized protein [Rhodnius prolixus]|uniref:Putative secreted protein panstrongylus lignarius n=1 Tax=Rhodnius prolixus TaxID=13249 RepID=A0A4P6DH74_RHOPR
MPGKQIIIFLLIICIALTKSATFLKKFPMEGGKPHLCFIGQNVLKEGQEYEDDINCRKYICSRSRWQNELILTIHTCGVIIPPEKCDLKPLSSGTPYPNCCNHKIVCKI